MRRMWNGVKKSVYKVTAYGFTNKNKKSSGIAAEWFTEDVNEAFEYYEMFYKAYSNCSLPYNYTITIHQNGKLIKSTTTHNTIWRKTYEKYI